MKVKEIVSMLNEGNKTRAELAEMLGVSTDSFRDELVRMGYKYDNSLKETIFIMKKEEKNKFDEMEFKPKKRKGKENSNINIV
ncbi:helix-turn-helix domain-containing protein, partial [Staphylococcus aureus]|uniref:helix-turn-helix domain-containing protein n=2 Tax=Bacilli TaxID=91061 RepID=UPI001963F24F